jgi:hypothetical protein
MNQFKSMTKPLMWFMTLLLVTLVTGCGGGGGKDPILGAGGAVAILTVPTGAVVPGGTCVVTASATIPTVSSTDPTNGNQVATTSTTGVAGNGKLITATFSLAMNATTINATTFSIGTSAGGVALVPASVTYDAPSKVGTLTTSAPLAVNTSYTVVITQGATSATGIPINCSFTWSFKTAATVAASPSPVNLRTASTYGTFGGSAGMTNTGNLTQINNGDIGTIATGNSSITGFHEKTGLLIADDHYTDTLGADSGTVSGSIYTCTNSTTGANSGGVNATECALATQARLDAQTAYTALAAMPSNGVLAGNLAGTTIHPGVYTNASTVMIQGGDLTLDALGDANAIFVFQIGSTLLVGGPGATAPQNIILAGGAQAKNVFWQVGTAATINAAGGGTMVGTIISQTGIVFSTAANTTLVTLNGRALSLVASVTMVDTVINVPAP